MNKTHTFLEHIPSKPCNPEASKSKSSKSDVKQSFFKQNLQHFPAVFLDNNLHGFFPTKDELYTSLGSYIMLLKTLGTCIPKVW